MSTTDRLNRLLLAEDWRRVYQSYKNAEFQSYDFDTLRRTMIQYLRDNYPEDFNDYIESSEYLALIDLIAFLGQNLSYRIDLNARENFLELADRRDSVLRLARLISYNATRNQTANGLMKMIAISTTENIVDSNNLNLSGQTVTWNDSGNANWNEQFTKVLNSALSENEKFGSPIKSGVIDSIPTNQYRFNSANSDVPVYSFTKNVDGLNLDFDLVSTGFNDSSILEETPQAGLPFKLIHRDDGKGSASNNTGFFVHFRQGVLDQGDFNLITPSNNQTVSVDANNVNNTDVWLWGLDADGLETNLWTKVDSTLGNNVIFNSTAKDIKNIYTVLTKNRDAVELKFADGTFGNLPQGSFRVYYRTSANRSLRITPDDMQNISIDIDYVSANGQTETMTMTFGLQYTVDNATASESSENIKTNAPATYYTQNRMITGEDYNVAPLGTNQEIVKVKATNRTSSGISRYFDLIDSTGKYSNTNIFGADGSMYKEDTETLDSFSFSTQTDIEGVIANKIEPMLSDKKTRNYYIEKFPKILLTDLNATWNQVTSATNLSTGKFTNSATSTNYQVGSFTASQMKYIEPGAMIKFEAPAGFHFMGNDNNKLMSGTADHPNSRTYVWTSVVSVLNDGVSNTSTGEGAISLNDVIPSNAIATQILPKFSKQLGDDVKSLMIDQAFAYNNFGLRYDVETRKWQVIDENNLNVYGTFSTGKTGDLTNQQLDASWIIRFLTNGSTYTVTTRGLRYVFESKREVRFYYDSADRNFNVQTGKTLQDKIAVLAVNTKPDSTANFNLDLNFSVSTEFRNAEGYVDSSKIELSQFDSDQDGIVDNPDAFNHVVDPETNPLTKYVFQKLVTGNTGTTRYDYVDAATEKIYVRQTSVGTIGDYTNGDIVYLVDSDSFKQINTSTNTTSDLTNYVAHVGRDKIKFQYVHTVDGNTRLDPSASNIIDMYLLTRTYDTDFRLWLNGTNANKPLLPSSDSLFTNFNGALAPIKSISDTLIYHPVKYKVLFGTNADSSLQATFKVVKNPEQVTNDADIKSRVIDAINLFFSLENWEFGDTFYFTELSTYVMNALAPDISTFVIVPNAGSQTFGSLYEIRSENDEIFISGAKVTDVQIIDAITASNLRSSGSIVTSTSTDTGLSGTLTLGSSSTSTSTSTSTGSTSYTSGGSSSGSSGGSSGGSGY